MKRYGNLWDKITCLDNIKAAHHAARKGKAYYKEVQMIDKDIDLYAEKIQTLLKSKSFSTSKYEVEQRFDGRKMRTIYKLPYFPDRIVQHALLNVVGPILTKSMIRDSFQSIRGRGTSDAAKRIKKFVRSDKCTDYALKIDIEKYYPSVNNVLMKDFIRTKIKCQSTLWLIDNIIDSIQGLPIGNYTSQHFGNWYLNRFDWAIKQQIKPSAYFRYCDDIVVFGNTTKELIEIKTWMEKELAAIGLSIKANWNIYDVKKNGIDFVGYVFKPEKTTLRRSIAKRFKKTCRKIINAFPCIYWDLDLSRIMAYKGWLLRCKASGLWKKSVKSKLRMIFPRQIKGAL